MKESRPYVMTARADAAAQTGERILDSAVALFWENPTDRISLEEVARRADVSVQTVIRRFGGRDGLIAAAAAREGERVARRRDRAPEGDLDAAVAVLMEHYEQMGDVVVRMLAEEAHTAGLTPIVDRGRRVHRDWCARVFAPALRRRRGRDRDRLLAQAVAVCDVQTWKLLRRDCALSPQEVQAALVELLEPLMGEPR